MKRTLNILSGRQGRKFWIWDELRLLYADTFDDFNWQFLKRHVKKMRWVEGVFF